MANNRGPIKPAKFKIESGVETEDPFVFEIYPAAGDLFGKMYKLSLIYEKMTVKDENGKPIVDAEGKYKMNQEALSEADVNLLFEISRMALSKANDILPADKKLAPLQIDSIAALRMWPILECVSRANKQEFTDDDK
jgi:hypothetical protein